MLREKDYQDRMGRRMLRSTEAWVWADNHRIKRSLLLPILWASVIATGVLSVGSAEPWMLQTSVTVMSVSALAMLYLSWGMWHTHPRDLDAEAAGVVGEQ